MLGPPSFVDDVLLVQEVDDPRAVLAEVAGLLERVAGQNRADDLIEQDDREHDCQEEVAQILIENLVLGDQAASDRSRDRPGE